MSDGGGSFFQGNRKWKIDNAWYTETTCFHDFLSGREMGLAMYFMNFSKVEGEEKFIENVIAFL